jgi:hypothetical protein
MVRAFLNIALVIGVLAFSGCAGNPSFQAYSGPVRSTNQVARLEGLYHSRSFTPLDDTGGWTEIYKVDDTVVPVKQRLNIELLPGPHCVEVAWPAKYFMDAVWKIDKTQRYTSLCFHAEAGKSYFVRTEQVWTWGKNVRSDQRDGADGPCFWITDGTNNLPYDEQPIVISQEKPCIQKISDHSGLE